MSYRQPSPLGRKSPKRKLCSRGLASGAISKPEQTAQCKTGTSSTTKKFPTQQTLSQASQRPLPPLIRTPTTSRAWASQETQVNLKLLTSSAAAARSTKSTKTPKTSKPTNNVPKKVSMTTTVFQQKKNFPITLVLFLP